MKAGASQATAGSVYLATDRYVQQLFLSSWLLYHKRIKLQCKTVFWPSFPLVTGTGYLYWWSNFCRNDSTDGPYCSGWMSLAFPQPQPSLCAGAVVSWGRKKLWLFTDVPFNPWLFYSQLMITLWRLWGLWTDQAIRPEAQKLDLKNL